MDFLSNFKDIQKEAFGIEPMDLCRMTTTEYTDYTEGFDKSKRNKKQRILDKLLDSLVSRARFVGNKTNRSFKKMIRSYAAIKIIIATGVFRKFAVDLSERTLPIALDFGQTEIAMDLCKTIFTHYNIKGEYKKAKRFHDQCLQLGKNHILETKAQWYVSDLACSIKFIKYDALKLQATQYLSDLVQEIPDSIMYKKALYLLMCYKYTIDGNYSKMEEVAAMAMEYFKNLHYEYLGTEMLFKRYLIEALLRLNRIDEAESLISDSPITNLTSFNHTDILFRNLMQKNDFDKARVVFNRLNKSKIKRQLEYTEPRLQLYRFYLGIIDKNTEIRRLKFDLKIVSDIKEETLRHHILICQILFNVLRGDNEFLKTNNQLLKKIARHRINSKRAKIFIRMLLMIPSKAYQPDIFKKKSNLLLTQLKNEPSDFLDLEILNFESIWELLTKRNPSFLRLDTTG